MRRGITRRDFVARAAAVGGSIALGCKESTDPQPQPDPGIDHIIVVTMENRSFDHLLGWHSAADGVQAGLSFVDAAGSAHGTHHLTTFDSFEFADPNHSFDGGRVAYDGGACDGWLRTPGNDLFSIGYYEKADLPFLGRAAADWLVLDRYFCSLMGPTYPNRILSLAATTDRLDNIETTSTLPTIWDRLIAAGRTGKNYGASSFVSSSLWGARYLGLMRPINDFYCDAAKGTLPDVSFVDPILTSDVGNSYHPPGDIRNGELFLDSVYRAVSTGPAWKNSLLIITFDEWGGFFDHVPPTAAQIPQAEKALGNVDGLRGFRVPTLLISPFVKRSGVSSTTYDHSSVLKLIETRWNLPALTERDASANDLMAEIDLTLPVTAAPQYNLATGPFGIGCS